MSPIDPQPSTASALGLIRRTLRKRRWPILTRWALLTVALVSAVYVMPPTGPYRVTSLLRFDPPLSSGCPAYINVKSLEPFFESQVPLITSPEVLTAAGANPKAAALPRIKRASDVVQELRKAVSVAIVPNTYLIEVSMTSYDPVESATIVNALVDASLRANIQRSDSMALQQIQNLDQYKAGLKNQLDELERKWKNYAARENIDASIKVDGGSLSPHAKAMIEKYRSIYKQLNELKIELAQAQAWQTTAKNARAKIAKAALTDQETLIEEQVQRRLWLDPEVMALRELMFEARSKLDEARRLSKQPNDPIADAAKLKVDGLRSQLFRLRDARSSVIRERIERDDRGKPLDPDLETREATAAVNKLLSKQTPLKERLEQIDVWESRRETDVFEIALMQDQWATLKEMQDQVTRRLEQLVYEAKEEATIRAVSPTGAKIPTRPISDLRPLSMAIIPFATFALVLAFFTGVEAWSGAKPKVETLNDWSLV